MPPPEVFVVGGGWSGLAAAHELASAGRPAHLLEAAPQLGGRARTAPFNEMAVDNGQHLMIGAYRQLRSLLKLLGQDSADALLRQPLTLHLHHLDGEPLRLRAPYLPAPLHLSAALLLARGLSWGERRAALGMSLRLYLSGFQLAEDCCVRELLQRFRQPQRLVSQLWEPLCLGALNTGIDNASAQVFLHVLRESFAHRRGDADLLIARQPLGRFFAEPMAARIATMGGQISTGTRVTRLMIRERAVTGLVVRRDGVEQLLDADQVILALPPHAAARLCEGDAALKELQAQLAGLDEQPIVTLYLRYPPATRQAEPMEGVVGGLSQWVFDRRHCGSPGLMAVVISGQGEHLALDNPSLIERVAVELAHLHPEWPPHLEARVIREKRATMSCEVAIESRRPVAETPVRGLWLAGDFTQPGYPATLEAALLSGVQCARKILHS